MFALLRTRRYPEGCVGEGSCTVADPHVHVRHQGVGCIGCPGIIYFSGERSKPVFCGAAGENLAKFKARMVNFMSKWDTRVVHG